MISKSVLLCSKSELRPWLRLLAVVFLAHAVEEWTGNFIVVDPALLFLAQAVGAQPEVVFVVLQMFWLAVICSVSFIGSETRGYQWMVFLIGCVAALEGMHVLAAIVRGEYFPGAITGGVLVVMGIVTWMRLARRACW